MNDQTLEQRKTQAGRCYNCGVPFCQTGCTLGGKPFGCPLHNLIPEWNDMLRKGNAAHALSRLLKVNCFPEFTGRVCPAFCQRACIRSEVDGAVTIRENELFLAEYGFEKGIIVPAEPKVRSGWTVAVIGSGPMGLTAAHLLSSRGHSVTVFEREAEPGGQLISAIPETRLPRDVVSRRIHLLEQQGVFFRTGETVEPEVLSAAYDSVIPCTGGKQNPFVAHAIAAGKRAAAQAELSLMGYTNLP